ncbi:MAG: hypothetical protein JWQ27_574 [Ferruginibacter sp.]|nr:hypothetical protein [Ferruginibacter sp.]
MVRRFREAGATTPERAIAPEQHIRPSFIFERMVRQGVFKPSGQNLYYLDEARDEELRKQRLKAMALLMIGLAILLAALYLSGKI